MLTRKIFSLVPLFLLAAATEGSGGSETPKAPTETAESEEQAPEIKTLPQARKRITELEAAAGKHAGEMATLKQDKVSAEKAQQQAEAAMNKVAGERDKTKGELETANTTIGTLNGKLDKANKDLQGANTNVARLERMCGVLGLDPDDRSQVPDAANDEDANSGAALYDEWKGLSGAAKTAFRRKHEKALDQYAARISRKS